MAVETLDYTYTTQSEVERICGRNAALLHMDDTGEGLAETSVWDDVIDEATDTINLYCEQTYDCSAMADNKWVRRQASYLAAFFLFQRRGDPGHFHLHYERIMQNLENIRTGKMQIPRLGTREDLTPALSNYVVSDWYRVTKIRVQPSISTGKSSGRQHLDHRGYPPY